MLFQPIILLLFPVDDDHSSGPFKWDVYRSDSKLSEYGTNSGSYYTLSGRTLSYDQERIEELMLDSTQLVKDVGTLLEGEEAVKEGLIDAVGGMSDALTKLHEMIEKKINKNR